MPIVWSTFDKHNISISHLKTGVESAPEMLHISNIPQTVGSVQLNIPIPWYYLQLSH